MPRWKQIGTLACLTAAAVGWVGCAAVSYINEKTNAELLDYATTSAGATITAVGSSGARSYQSLINGIKDPAAWSEGEGWEYNWKVGAQHRNRPGIRNQGGVIEGIIQRGGPWIMIQLKEPQYINRVVIHEANTLEMPAIGIENAFLQVRNMNDDLRPWTTVAFIENSWVYVPGRQTFKTKPVTKIYFNQVKTNTVRFVINTVKKKKRAGVEYVQNVNRRMLPIEMTVRLLEIEVTGSEASPDDPPKSAGAGASKSNTICTINEPL